MSRLKMNVNVENYALQGAAKLLIDHQLWSDVKMFCMDAANNDNLDNAAKHAKVKADLMFIFKDVGSVVLNLAIELGTLWVQNELKATS